MILKPIFEEFYGRAGNWNLVLPVSDPAFKNLSLHLLAELLQEKDALLMFGTAFHLKKYFPKRNVKRRSHNCVCITEIC